MAQKFIFENAQQTTVNFSTVNIGDTFIYGNAPCVKLDKNNPNYVVMGTGVNGKLNDTDQVYLPKRALMKTE